MPPDVDQLLEDQTWLRALARSLVADPNAADDVAQEAAIRLWTQPPAHDGARRSWMRTVVTRLTANRSRGERRRAARELGTYDDGRAASSPDDVVALWEIRRRVVDAVLALDEPYRTTVLLRWFEGLSRAETAARMDVPEETVRTRQRRALTRLRTSLAALDPTTADDERPSRALLLLAGWDREATAPASTVAGATTGVLLVTTTQKVIAAAALVVASALGMWWAATRGDPEAPSPGPETADTTTPGDAGSGALHERRHVDARPEDTSTVGSPATGDASLPATAGTPDRDRDLHGVVVDAAGAPVAGARLVVRTYPGLAMQVPTDFVTMFRPVEGASTTSARDGTFRIQLDAVDPVALHVSHPDLADTELAARSAGERVRITLQSAVPLVITVRDAADAPVAGASLVLFENPFDGDTFAHLTAVTGDDGTLRVTSLPPGTTALVTALAPGHSDTPRGRVVLSGPDEQRLDLRFAPGRRLTGVVRDAASHAPVAGARVGAGQIWAGAVTSAADGSWTMDSWSTSDERERQLLHVTAPGYATEVVPVTDAVNVDVELTPGASYGGRLLDATRAPLGGVSVMVVAERAPGGAVYSLVAVQTDAGGRFLASGLRSELPHTLYAISPDGRIALEVPAVGTPGDTLDLGDVTVSAGRTLSGRVVDAAGAGVPRVTVSISPQARPGERIAGPKPAHTDDLGRFRVPRLAPGRATVVASRDRQQLAKLDVDIPADRDPESIELTTSGTTAFVVEVVDDDGTPVRDATVNLVTASRQRLVAEVDAQGLARFELTEAVATVTALPRDPTRREAFTNDASVSPPRGASQARVVLHRAGVVEGVVRDETGAPVTRGSVVVALRGKAMRFMTQLDDAGRFRALVRLRGVVDLTYSAESFDGSPDADPMVGHVEGVTAPASSLEMVVRAPRPGRSLTLRTVDPDGRPVANVRVTLWRSGLHEHPSGVSDAAGLVRFDDLLELEHGVTSQLDASDDNVHLAEARQIHAIPDGQTLDVPLRRARPVRGMVVTADGTPVAACTVNVDVGPGRQSPYVFTRDDGTFVARIPGDETGPFDLRAVSFAEATPQWSGDANGVAAGAQDVRIVIAAPKR